MGEPTKDFAFNIQLNNVVLFDEDGSSYTIDDQIIANGYARFNNSLNAGIDIEDHKLKYFIFENILDMDSKIEITTTLSKEDIYCEGIIWSKLFPSFVAGYLPPGIPVVVAPYLEVFVGNSGEVSVNATSVTQDVSLTAGVSYQDGSWCNLNDFPNPTFSFNVSGISEPLNYKAFTGPRLKLFLYGVAGPFAEIDAYSRLRATSSNWTLHGGLDVLVGAKAEVLGKTLASYSATVIDYEKLLTQGQIDIEEDCEMSTITDSRDNQVYNTVKIGNQWWMAENLNYETQNSWEYNNDSDNGDIYGRLYEWETATQVCPSNWHLPSDNEWQTLVNYAGGENIAGGKLKEQGISHWNSPNTGATDEFCFTALPAGVSLEGNIIPYSFLNSKADFWTSTIGGDSGAWGRGFEYNSEKVFRLNYGTDGLGLSVRCVKD